MQKAPETITSEDAAYIKSREARATGQAQPPSDSMSADAQRLASINEGAAKPPQNRRMSTEQQSVNDRLENFEQAAKDVAAKMVNNPDAITKEEGDLLHSREQRAFGSTSKGGIASQAQSVAAQTEKKKGTA